MTNSVWFNDYRNVRNNWATTYQPTQTAASFCVILPRLGSSVLVPRISCRILGSRSQSLPEAAPLPLLILQVKSRLTFSIGLIQGNRLTWNMTSDWECSNKWVSSRHSPKSSRETFSDNAFRGEFHRDSNENDDLTCDDVDGGQIWYSSCGWILRIQSKPYSSKFTNCPTRSPLLRLKAYNRVADGSSIPFKSNQRNKLCRKNNSLTKSDDTLRPRFVAHYTVSFQLHSRIIRQNQC